MAHEEKECAFRWCWRCAAVLLLVPGAGAIVAATLGQHSIEWLENSCEGFVGRCIHDGGRGEWAQFEFMGYGAMRRHNGDHTCHTDESPAGPLPSPQSTHCHCKHSENAHGNVPL